MHKTFGRCSSSLVLGQTSPKRLLRLTFKCWTGTIPSHLSSVTTFQPCQDLIEEALIVTVLWPWHFHSTISNPSCNTKNKACRSSIDSWQATITSPAIKMPMESAEESAWILTAVTLLMKLLLWLSEWSNTLTSSTLHKVLSGYFKCTFKPFIPKTFVLEI